MSEKEVQLIMDTVKSVNLTNEQTQVTTTIPSVDSLYKNQPLKPVVDQMGSAYTAQNNITIENISHSPDVTDVTDVDYSYINTVKKPYYVKTFQVTSANTVGSNIYTMNLPGDYFAANHVLQNVGATFKSFRGDFHMLISVQGTPLTVGALAAVVTYGTYQGNYGSATESLNNIYYRQHAIIDYSDNSNTVDLVIPFRHYKNGIDPFQSCHSVRFTPLVQLAGQTSVTITVSMFVENPVFRFLRPKPTTFADVFEGDEGRQTQGFINITNINNTMNDLIDSTLPMNLTGDTLDINPSMMDDVPIPTNPQPMLVKYNSINNTNNPFPVERATLQPGAQRIADKYTYGTQIDEMAIQSICKKDNFVKRFDILTTTPVNNPIYATYVTPCTYWIAAASQHVNPMSYITSQLKFWRGGLKYKFRFYMNRFQSVKLYAAMFYKTDAEPTVVSDFSTSHGVVLDIGGDKREVEIEIPYNAETPWLFCPVRLGQDLTTGQADYYSLGKLVLYSMTPLVSPTGSPTSITCDVTVSVCDDFEYAAHATSNGTAQAITLSKPSVRTPNDIVDIIPSTKTIMKKYTKRINHRQRVDMSKFKLVADANNVVRDWNSYSMEGPTSLNQCVMTYPYSAQLPFSRLFNATRGGRTFRIEMTAAPEQPDSIMNHYALVPFCVYINGPFTNADWNQWAPEILESLQRYFITDWLQDNNTVTTPYVIQPINPTVITNGTKVVYEVDCPYQGVNKYHPTSPAGTRQVNGILIWGWYSPVVNDIPETFYQFHTQVYSKLSDDARFGLAEIGSVFIQPQTFGNWDSQLVPSI